MRIARQQVERIWVVIAYCQRRRPFRHRLDAQTKRVEFARAPDCGVISRIGCVGRRFASPCGKPLLDGTPVIRTHRVIRRNRARFPTIEQYAGACSEVGIGCRRNYLIQQCAPFFPVARGKRCTPCPVPRSQRRCACGGGSQFVPHLARLHHLTGREQMQPARKPGFLCQRQRRVPPTQVDTLLRRRFSITESVEQRRSATQRLWSAGIIGECRGKITVPLNCRFGGATLPNRLNPVKARLNADVALASRSNCGIEPCQCCGKISQTTQRQRPSPEQIGAL